VAHSEIRMSRAGGGQPPGESAAASQTERRIEAATSAFDRIYERQTGLSGTSRTTSLQQAAKLKELDDLARENKIAERIARLKASRT
jgi:phage shock protein A